MGYQRAATFNGILGDPEKKGEGIEYHVMLLSLLLIVIVRGSGAMSIDLWLISFRT